MKKLLTFALALLFALSIIGCGKSDACKLSITVPAGSEKAFYCSDEEISATGKKITISSTPELGDTEVLLFPVNELITAGYVATPLTPETPAEFDATAGEWFKVGVLVQNDTDTDQTVYVEVSGVEVRIE